LLPSAQPREQPDAWGDYLAGKQSEIAAAMPMTDTKAGRKESPMATNLGTSLPNRKTGSRTSNAANGTSISREIQRAFTGAWVGSVAPPSFGTTQTAKATFTSPAKTRRSAGCNLSRDGQSMRDIMGRRALVRKPSYCAGAGPVLGSRNLTSTTAFPDSALSSAGVRTGSRQAGDTRPTP